MLNLGKDRNSSTIPDSRLRPIIEILRGAIQQGIFEPILSHHRTTRSSGQLTNMHTSLLTQYKSRSPIVNLKIEWPNTALNKDRQKVGLLESSIFKKEKYLSRYSDFMKHKEQERKSGSRSKSLSASKSKPTIIPKMSFLPK